MAAVTVIGRGTTIRGRVSGAVDLQVHGFIEGEVNVGGDATVEASGLVGANISARSVVVRGAVRGDITAEQSVALEEGARVVGEVKAPRVVIAAGGLVRGYVQSGGVAAAPATRVAAAPAGRTLPKPAPAVERPMARPAPAPAPPPRVEVKPAPLPARPQQASAPARPASNGAPFALAGGSPKGPPPPVVPALKKAKGALSSKKKDG